jgi:presequence protease
MPAKFDKIGDRYGEFTVTNVINIPELQCQLRELNHPSGAQVMHLANDDPENVFCLSFQTIPATSNGVAHILEHTVLCGSEKYPIKDPFFSMRRRSLNTFMNAMTGPDFTCYPAASQVAKDFYQLLEVYLDAVFHPLIKELSFHQEGHRLEFSTLEDPSSPLLFKGVVYNEMKGSLSNPSARLIEAVNAALFPDITYGINSGGDPKVIPDLTYQELLDFHKTYYHPGRCLFYFYGNMPLDKHLDFIAEHALKGISKTPAIPPLPRQKRFSEPKKIAVSYPFQEEEDPIGKTWLAFAWLTCDVLQQEELLALHVLEIALLDTDASPLKLKLLKSGLCKQVGSYLESDISEAPWLIILQGCEEEKADLIEQFLFHTLETIQKEGIPKELINNALHQLELFRSEINGGHSPHGLSLFMRSALLKQHGADAHDGLMIHSIFKRLRDKMDTDEQFFSHLISKYLLNNPHYVRLVLTPDKQLVQKELEAELDKLKQIQSSLKEDQIGQIIAQAKELQALQQKDEDLSVLPKISIKDVPKESRDYHLSKEIHGPYTVYRHGCFTNNILYADLVFPMPLIQEKELPYLRLFFQLFTQLGCGGRTYAENLDYIQAHTGGVNSSFSLNLQADDTSQFFPYLYIHGKALHHKIDKLFSLFRDLITSVNFSDRERVKEILLKHYTALETSLNQNALNYAINLSASGLSASSKITNECYGLPYYHTVSRLVQNFDKEINPLIEQMQQLQDRMLNREYPHLVITCQDEAYQFLKENHYFGVTDVSLRPIDPWQNTFEVSPIASQGRQISSPVAFTSKVFKTVSYTDPDAPALSVAANLFDNIVLHLRVREQGGAYGGGASSNSLAGFFYFFSFRDPYICHTLLAFEEAVQTILQGKFKADDLEEAKLEMIQALDTPIPPGSRGKTAYNWMRKGQTLEARQAFRTRLLQLTKQDIIRAVEKHIVPHMAQGASVTFAGRELFEKENARLAEMGRLPLEIVSL